MYKARHYEWFYISYIAASFKKEELQIYKLYLF